MQEKGIDLAAAAQGPKLTKKQMEDRAREAKKRQREAEDARKCAPP